MKHFDWAEPGDPPPPGNVTRRRRHGSTVFSIPPAISSPLAKPVRHGSVTAELEIELIRLYREDGDLDALNRLVESYRPMVVRMAKHRWRGNGTSLAALVEYGMMGVRIPAEPLRPSLTKKGKLVGFDPTSGTRFGTYARHYAEKEMRGALADDPGPALRADFEDNVAILFEDWNAEPGSIEDLPNHLDEAARRLAIAVERRWGYPQSAVYIELTREGREQTKFPRRWTLWNPPPGIERKVRARNFLKHPRTEIELANMDRYHASYWLRLETFEDVAADGMDGFRDDEDVDHEPWEPATGGFNPKVYRLPKAVLEHRWKLGKERYGNILYSFNQGVGLYDKRGRKLPVYCSPDGAVTVKRKRRFTPFLCRYPLASIYLLRRGNIIFDLDLGSSVGHFASGSGTGVSEAKPNRRVLDLTHHREMELVE